MDPLVTVVVCAYNDAGFVERAVQSALGQRGLPDDAIELIATDDGSTDGTRELLAGFGDAISLVTQDQLGPTVATNRAIARAHGRFVALLDADDEWFPDKLLRQLDLMERRPEVGLVHGDLEVVDGAGAVLSASKYERFGQRPVIGHALGPQLSDNEATTSAILVRTELVRAVPPTPDWAWCRDWWIATQIAARHEIDAILEPVGRYRIHGGNFSAVEGDAARTLTLWHRDLRVRRILIRTLDLETASLDHLAAAWRRLVDFARHIAGSRGVPLTEVLPVEDADRAEAAERLAEARAMLAEDPLAAGRRALQALAANPYEGDGPQLLEAARARLAASPSNAPTAAVEPVPATVLDAPRAFVGLVLADEAIADPDLLRAWAACFDGDDDATLVLYAPDAEPGAIHPRLVAALASAGIPADDARDMTLVAAPRTDALEAALAREAHALLSRAPGPRALAVLPPLRLPVAGRP